jgi:hypothetical protein
VVVMREGTVVVMRGLVVVMRGLGGGDEGT